MPRRKAFVDLASALWYDVRVYYRAWKSDIITALVSGFVAVGAGLFGCGKGTGDPAGYDDPGSLVYRAVLSPKTGWRDTYYDVYVPTGKSTRLVIGSYAGYTSRALMRFDLEEMPKLVELDHVTSVALRLAYYREPGKLNDDEYAEGDVTISAHRLYCEFDEDRATWYKARRYRNWTEAGGDFGPAVAKALVGSPSNRRKYINLDITDTFFEWVNNPRTNFGILLKAENESGGLGIKEFFSIDEKSKPDAPELVITYEEDGEKAHYSVIPEKDCFITLADERFPGERVNGYDDELEFGSFNGYGRRLLVRFDVSPAASGIPPDASIVKARLSLFYKPAGRAERVNIAGYQLLEDFSESQNQAELEFIRYHDNEKVAAREYKNEKPGYVDIYLSELVQEWVTGTRRNYGVMIKADDETDAALFPTFASGDTPYADRVPYLEVLFTSPRPPWFNSPVNGPGALGEVVFYPDEVR